MGAGPRQVRPGRKASGRGHGEKGWDAGLGAGPWRRGRGGAVGAAVLRVTTVRDEGGRGTAGSSAARSAVGSQAVPVGPPGQGDGMGTRLG